MNSLTKIIIEEYNRLLNEESVNDIYKKYYKGKVYNSAFKSKDQFIKTSEDDGMFEVIIEIDPYTKLPNKMGKYSKWLLSVFKNTCLNSSDVRRFMEDEDTIRYYLETFDKLVLSKKLPMELRDINKFKTYQDLWKAIQPYVNQYDNYTDEDLAKWEKELIQKGEAEVVFDGNHVLIVIPKTEKAACVFGAHTSWCTAAGPNSLDLHNKKGTNRFKDYDSEAPLYIIIDKQFPLAKYQLHVPTNQLMDLEDIPVEEPLEFFANNDEVFEYFSKHPHLIMDFIGYVTDDYTEDYTVNPDNSVDVHEDIRFLDLDIKRLPVIFNKVFGDFLIDNCKLTTLKGFPKYVSGEVLIINNTPNIPKKDIVSICKADGGISVLDIK